MKSHVPIRALTTLIVCGLVGCSDRASSIADPNAQSRLRIDPSRVRSAVAQLHAAASERQRVRDLGRLSASEDAQWAERIDSISTLASRLIGIPERPKFSESGPEPWESTTDGVIDEARSSTTISLGGTTNKVFSYTELTAPAGGIEQHIVGTVTTNGTQYPIDVDRGSGSPVPVISYWDSEVSLPEIDCNKHSASVTAATDHVATWFIYGMGPHVGSARTTANRPINSPECPYAGPRAHFSVSASGASGTDGLTVQAVQGASVTFNFTANVTLGDAAVASYQWTATNASGTSSFGSGATASFTTSQTNTGIRLTVTDGNGKSTVVDGAVNLTVNPPDDPDPPPTDSGCDDPMTPAAESCDDPNSPSNYAPYSVTYTRPGYYGDAPEEWFTTPEYTEVYSVTCDVKDWYEWNADHTAAHYVGTEVLSCWLVPYNGEDRLLHLSTRH
jgi:hypothetical protein